MWRNQIFPGNLAQTNTPNTPEIALHEQVKGSCLLDRTFLASWCLMLISNVMRL